MFDCIPTCQQKWIHSMYFLQVPKTATSSISLALADRNLIHKHRGLLQERFAKHPLYRGVFDVRHIPLSQCFEIFGRQMYNFFSFAVKRNPFSRLESAFFFGKENKLAGLYGLDGDSSFEDFVNFLFDSYEANRQDILILKPQVEWVFYGDFQVTEIIPFENIQVSWAKMLKQYSINGLPAELPWKNRSEKKYIEWPKDLKNKVEKIYSKDFEVLGY